MANRLFVSLRSVTLKSPSPVWESDAVPLSEHANAEMKWTVTGIWGYLPQGPLLISLTHLLQWLDRSQRMAYELLTMKILAPLPGRFQWVICLLCYVLLFQTFNFLGRKKSRKKSRKAAQFKRKRDTFMLWVLSNTSIYVLTPSETVVSNMICIFIVRLGIILSPQGIRWDLLEVGVTLMTAPHWRICEMFKVEHHVSPW